MGEGLMVGIVEEEVAEERAWDNLTILETTTVLYIYCLLCFPNPPKFKIQNYNSAF
jgi:hypothetical protein